MRTKYYNNGTSSGGNNKPDVQNDAEIISIKERIDKYKKIQDDKKKQEEKDTITKLIDSTIESLNTQKDEIAYSDQDLKDFDANQIKTLSDEIKSLQHENDQKNLDIKKVEQQIEEIRNT